MHAHTRAPHACTHTHTHSNTHIYTHVYTHRASLAQASASDEGVLDQVELHQEGFANLAVDAAALKMPRLQVGVNNYV